MSISNVWPQYLANVSVHLYSIKNESKPPHGRYILKEGKQRGKLMSGADTNSSGQMTKTVVHKSSV